METQTFPLYRVQKGCLQRAGLGLDELDWEGHLVWESRSWTGMEGLVWGWTSWNADGGSWSGLEEFDWGWEELPVSSGTLAGFISLGFHCCLIFKYRYILCNCCHIFNFKVIHYLKFRWIFKFGISTPLPESLLLSLAAKDRKMADRKTV